MSETMTASQITEASILESYLLLPSPLATILPYQEYTKLFPPSYRSHPALKPLYRDFQFQRSISIEDVRQNIERECYKASSLKAQLARQIRAEDDREDEVDESKPRKRRRVSQESESESDAEAEDDDQPPSEASANVTQSVPTARKAADLDSKEIELDRLLFGPRGLAQPPNHLRYHTPASLLNSMSAAIAALEVEIADLESEGEVLKSDMEDIVGGLSDLRYGKLARSSGPGGVEASMEDDIVKDLKNLQNLCHQRMSEKDKAGSG